MAKLVFAVFVFCCVMSPSALISQTNGMNPATVEEATTNGVVLSELENATIKLGHPQRVVVPEDIPFSLLNSYVGKDGKDVSELTLPCIDYQRGFYDGWQSCLFDASAKDVSLLRPELGFASTQHFYTKGFSSGYTECLKKVKEQVRQGESEKQIQRWCLLAYSPLSRPPPPSSNPKKNGRHPVER